MDLLELFDTSKTFERVVLSGGQTDGHVLPQRMEEDDDDEDMASSMDVKPSIAGRNQEYALEYQMKEEAMLETGVQERFGMLSHKERMNGLEYVTGASGQSGNPLTVNGMHSTRVYRTYNFDINPDNVHPITSFRDEIVKMIHSYSAVVIRGFTGCGKTTQVPQYILDHHREMATPCNIIVTQPRRIAAISIAKRVSHERRWPLGSVVGFKVGLISETSDDTLITYCTTGVLLNTLISEKNMNKYTHVILDEVHERDQEMDFLLLLVRKMQRSTSPRVKVILMSATFNVERFSEYFALPGMNRVECAPIVPIEKKRKFKISEYYLDDLQELRISIENKIDEPTVTNQHILLCDQLIKVFDTIEAEEKQQSSTVASSRDAYINNRGSVLVFLPGLYEIESLFSKLGTIQEKNNWLILPLHSSITSSEQSAVFSPVAKDARKIILSTNIAESSITVPDTRYVIDMCMTKELVSDPDTNFSTLQLTWASKTNCRQRSGRVGRVSNGRVYRLVHKQFFENLPEEQTPEILRCPLERIVLMAKILNMGEPKSILALAIDPPNLSNIERTILVLKEAGGLLMNSAGSPSATDGDITFLGRVMAKLPLDIHMSKLIVLGQIFSVLENSIIMAAAMSLKSIFNAPFNKGLDAYQSRLAWADSSCSDSIALLNAYKVWRSRMQAGFFQRGDEATEKQWAKRYFVQLRVIREVCDLVNDLKRRLKLLGIEESYGAEKVKWTSGEEPLVLKIVLAGAFYPNFFVRGAQGGQVNEKDAIRFLVGRDPFSTVYLKNFPLNQPGELYTRPVKELFTDCSKDLKVSFDHSKIFIQFAHDEIPERTEEQPFHAHIPGRILLPVYKAIKMRQLRIPLPLNVLPPNLAMQRLEESRPSPFEKFSKLKKTIELENYKQTMRDKWTNRSAGPSSFDMPPPESTDCMESILPKLDTSVIHFKVSHVVNAGHFWAQYAAEEFNSELGTIFHDLNLCRHPDLVPLRTMPKVGDLVVAPYKEKDLKMYRARVVSIKSSERKTKVKVFYIDYGNSETVDLKDIRGYGSQLQQNRFHLKPGLAFECILSEVQPSLVLSSSGKWTKEANKYFMETTFSKSLFGTVYSVVNGVVALEVKLDDIDSLNTSVNADLIRKGYGQTAEEGFLSKENHEIRLKVKSLSIHEKLAHEEQQCVQSYVAQGDPIPPEKSEAVNLVNLHGPFSPLEMSIFHLIRVGEKKSAVIEASSVNSVLLDHEPQDSHDRLVVAASVQTSQDGTKLKLCQTTLLPNIRGLPALLSLMFSPSIELRRNTDKTCLTGMLCGLGYNKTTGKSYFPQHDMEVTFDTHFSMEDLQDVNRMRYWFNVALYTNKEETMPSSGPNDVHKYQSKVKESLMKLLSIKRPSREIFYPKRKFRWRQIDEDSLLFPGDAAFQNRDIYPLHWGVTLEKEEMLTDRARTTHARELLRIARDNTSITEVTCCFCRVKVFSANALKLHLESSDHRAHEFKIIRPEYLD